MTEGLDNLLAEVFSKSILKEKEEGELDSDCEEKKKKSKKSKHKSKSSSKRKRAKSCDNKRSHHSSSDSKHKSNNNNENESEIMKLLLSSKLKSYAEIEFKDNETDSESVKSKNSSNGKNSKHKRSKKDKSKHSKKSSKQNESEKYGYEEDDYDYQHIEYYSSKSTTNHEDYYYGSYYEGMAPKPTHSSRKRSRPLSPLYDSSWKSSNHSSRSRSPLNSKLDYSRRSLSPNGKRSHSPLFKARHQSNKFKEKRRRSLSPTDRYNNRKHNIKDESYERVDKEKLLQIARENLVKMIEKGDLPKGTDINKLKLRHLRELTSQKSIQQWTEFCRAISTLETVASFDSDLDSDCDSDDDRCSIKSEVSASHPFSIRHPFKLKERKDIEIRVRDFIQLKSRSASEMALELRQSFPVSSGNQHRRKELEWKEVEQMPPPPPPPPKKNKKIETKLTEIEKQNSAFTIQSSTDADTSATISPITSSTTSTTDTTNDITTSDANTDSQTFVAPNNESQVDSVFPQSTMPIDIGSIMAQRLSAMRKLNDDPHNVVALKQMYQTNQMMTEWAESKIVPGQFTGSTGANVLSADQLNGPVNAWTRKDQFKTAAPITDGIGMYLLLKMGWNPGQGLGKNNEGVVDPISLEIKFDKKGLVAEAEQVRNLPLQLVATGGPKMNGKNPVSILHELVAKKRWGQPVYESVSEEGPDHRKNFTFKVTVNGVEYQPSVSSANKKQAKALAAGVCLQAFGLLPKDKS